MLLLVFGTLLRIAALKVRSEPSYCDQKIAPIAGLRLLDHLTRLEVKSAAAAGGDGEADAEKKAAEKREKGEEQEEDEAEADVDDIDDEDDDYYQARICQRHHRCAAAIGQATWSCHAMVLL